MIDKKWGYICVLTHTVQIQGILNLIYVAKKDNEENLISFDLSIEDHRDILANIYCPNTDSLDFFFRIWQWLLYIEIFCGGFNTAINQNRDTQDYSHVSNPRARGKLLQIMSNLNLMDYYRVLNPDRKC